MAKTTEDLSARIQEVFKRIVSPSLNDIAVETDWDAESIQHDFAPFVRTAAPERVLTAHAKSLPALTPRAFVYFLRDYLLHSLDVPDGEVAENLLYRLRSVRSQDTYWRERLELLSADQKSVIADLCEWLGDRLHPNATYLRRTAAEAQQLWRLESQAERATTQR